MRCQACNKELTEKEQRVLEDGRLETMCSNCIVAGYGCTNEDLIVHPDQISFDETLLDFNEEEYDDEI